MTKTFHLFIIIDPIINNLIVQVYLMIRKQTKKQSRPGWNEYFINIAKAVSARATC